MEACDVKSYIYREGAKLPGTGQITKAGYFFDGWYDNPEFKGCKYLKINNEASGNKKFYAKWKEVKYQLQFVDDDE